MSTDVEKNTDRSAPPQDQPTRIGDRTPPQDNEAEQSVLGAMLMSKDAIADVVEVVKGPDFYRPAHEYIYDAILDLYGRGEPADAITVANELGRSGQLSRVGGHVYLHDLLASVSIAANASYYATIVREKAVLRRLIEASVKIAQMGYAGEGDVAGLVDQAQAVVYAVADGKTSEDYQPLADIMEATLDEIEAISSRSGEMAGVPTGFIELDELTNGLHGGQMIILAARPAMGKSTLGLDFARSCSIKHGMTSAIFSLEMSKVEIVMRLLSAEAQIPLNHIRKGTMNEDDWQRLANKMGVISEAPLFIDDSPNLTMMEIRAKARRLKQRHDLKLIIIDYMQLMSSGKKVESRQLEVSEFSRQIKLLAKELEVPVVAMSQLNRGPEQRTDRTPMLSDLRESGCLTADTRVLRADTGAEVTMGELVATGAKDVPVWSINEHHRLVPATLTHAFSSGVKQVFRMTTTSGRVIKASANHPFLTLDGWKALEDLEVGGRLAIPRIVPPAVGEVSESQVLESSPAKAPQPDTEGSDLELDGIKSIEHIGEQEVFDVTVPGTHNFIADGVVVHNSLEQDADMVILLNRDDVYDKESPRLGEADFIVAKHRNGPTKTVVTAFQGHYSRFVDMQH